MAENISMKLSLDYRCRLIATYVRDDTVELLEHIINPCGLPESEETDFTNYAIVEYITDNNDNVDYSSFRIHVIESNEDPEINESYPITLSNDGSFTFHRMMVPSFAKLAGSTKGQYFWYKKDIPLIYKLDINTTNPADIKDSDVVADPSKIWDERLFQLIMYYFGKKFFSLCKINNCLIKIEKDMFKKNKTDFTCTNEDSNKRDFLLVTIHMLEYLSTQGRYDDAQDIIDTVMTCGGICDNTKYEVGGCNCG